jgi:hypothetical protein
VRGPRRDARLGAAACVIAVGLAVAAAGTAAAGTAAARGTHARLRPDLVIRPITDIHLKRGGGVHALRFSTIVGNRGPGVLELVPKAEDCDGNGDFDDDRTAYQQIYEDTNDNGHYDGDDLWVRERKAGCSYFHPAHDHWHFEGFARYDLTRPHTGRIVATAKKVSFCVRDSFRFGHLPGSPTSAQYGECTQDSTTGLSIGWSDYYPSYLEGQELDVTGLPNARYCLRMTVDPADHVREAGGTNNVRSRLVRLRRTSVTDLGRSCVEAAPARSAS